jgi:hypothetical protein
MSPAAHYKPALTTRNPHMNKGKTKSGCIGTAFKVFLLLVVVGIFAAIFLKDKGEHSSAASISTPVSTREKTPIAPSPLPSADHRPEVAVSPPRPETLEPNPISIEAVLDSELPTKVTLIAPVEFRIANGKGKVTARAGTTVDLISRKGSTLSVKYLDAKEDIQFTQTSLLEDVTFERERLAQVKAKQPDAEAREMPPSLNTEKADKPDDFIGMTRERMVSLMGRPLAVKSGSNSTDGGFKIYSYSNEKGKETFFTIWDDEGTIDSGMYRGAYFFKKLDPRS